MTGNTRLHLLGVINKMKWIGARKRKAWKDNNQKDYQIYDYDEAWN